MRCCRLIVFLLLSLIVGLRSSAQINTDRVMMMGRSALYYEDYVLSIQRFNQVINAKPYLPEPYFYRGLAKFYLEDYVGSDMDVSEAIERNPYLQQYYVLRGLVRVNLHRYEDAERDYIKATEMDPLDDGCWHNMVLCQVEQEAYDRADSSLTVMIRQWPQKSENYCLKAQVSFLTKDTLKAEKWLDKAVEVNPYEGQAWSMKAAISLSHAKYKAAEEQLDKALLQSPRDCGLYINRAMARYYLNNLRGAMSDYDAAIELEPNNYQGHYNRALLRAQVGDDNRAIEDFNFVLEREPDDMLALYNRALLLDNTGDYRAAIRDISAVIEEYPQFWDGYSMRASIRRKIGDVYGAERDEFKVLKARVEGVKKSNKTHKTRKQSNHDVNEYDALVESDSQELEKQYESAYRGRVQNQHQDLCPEPYYVLTYYRRVDSMRRYVGYHPLLEELNAGNVLPKTIYLSNNEGSLSEGLVRMHFDGIADATQRLSSQSMNTQLYIKRALDYYHVRDFDAALADLDLALCLDSLHVTALMLRAQMRCAQINSSNGSNGQLLLNPTTENRIQLGRALDDLKEVIRLQPDLTYAYYNMGLIYVQLHEYEQAVTSFTEAIEQDDRFPDAYFNRGVALLLDGHTEKGLADLSQAGEYGLYGAYNLIKKYSKQKK